MATSTDPDLVPVGVDRPEAPVAAVPQPTPEPGRSDGNADAPSSRVGSIPPSDLGREERVLCLAARTTLDEAARAELRRSVDHRLDWERLWSLAHLHEVAPLLGETLRDADGGVPAEFLERATRRRHVTLTSNARLAEALLPILEAMGEAGVPAMPVKGLVLAEHLYGSLAARPCADLDVLVQPADLPAARAVLRDLGFRQNPRPGYKALVHQFHDPAWGRGTGREHVRVELHWALWADSERRLGTKGLWERAVPATLLDRPVRILSPEDMLLHLTIHRTRSALRLRWVADVAELVRRHGATLDWDAVLDRARAARARTASWVVLSLARDLLGAPVPERVLAALEVSQPKRALLELTCGRRALFRAAPSGDVTQQPHLALRAFEEDGPRAITAGLARSAVRPIREGLHDRGIVRARRRMPEAG